MYASKTVKKEQYRVPSAAVRPAMAARLLLRSLRVLSACSATLPPPSARCSHSGTEARLETPSAKKLTDIGIRRIFSSEHDIFREGVRKLFEEEVIPYHEEWEKAGEVSTELWEKAGKQDLLGINIAEKHGGLGGDLLSTAVTQIAQALVSASIQILSCPILQMTAHKNRSSSLSPR